MIKNLLKRSFSTSKRKSKLGKKEYFLNSSNFCPKSRMYRIYEHSHPLRIKFIGLGIPLMSGYFINDFFNGPDELDKAADLIFGTAGFLVSCWTIYSIKKTVSSSISSSNSKIRSIDLHKDGKRMMITRFSGLGFTSKKIEIKNFHMMGMKPFLNKKML